MLVAIAVTGWLALTGRVDWLARLAKPRVERALLAAGVEADALDIGRLSLRGGRIEHARLRFDGGTAEVHGLEVALGVGNIWAGRAGAVVVDRLEFGLSEASGRSDDAALPKLEELPFDSIEVREWSVAIPIVTAIRRVSGSLRATPGENDVVGFEGEFKADEASGRFAGDYDGRTPGLVLRLSEMALTPEGMLVVLHALPEGSVPSGLTFGWESAIANVELAIANDGPVAVTADLELKNATVARGELRAELGAAAVAIQWKRGAPVAFELEAAATALRSGETRVVADTLQFIGGAEGGSVSLGRAVVTSGGREARGHGLGSFAVGADGAGLSAEGTWILESAKFDGFTAGGAEVTIDLKDGVLFAATEGLAIDARVKADVEKLEVAFTDLGRAAPGVNGRAVATVDLAALFPEGAQLAPAREKVRATFLGLLGAGRESLRVEFALDDAARTVESAEFAGGFTGALAGVVTLDAANVSGSVAGELKNVSLKIPDRGSASFPDAKLKWSTGRVWIDAIRGWPELEAPRALRELLWVSNIDLRATDGTVDLASLGSAAGLSATIVSNGADLSEQAGGSLVVSARSVRAADREFADLGATLAFGLDGGTVVADIVLRSPRIPLRWRQTVGWRDCLALDGTYTTGSVDLSRVGGLGGLAPGLAGVTASGTATVSGPLRFGPNGFEAGARVELGAVGLAWPDDMMKFSGVSGVIDLDSLRPLHADAGQRLSIGSAKIQEIEFTEGAIEFGIPAPDSVLVTRLDAGTLGGKVTAAPFAFDPRDPKPATTIELSGLRLEQVLEFFPDVPATAEGGIVGAIPVSWDGGTVAFGAGFIALQPGELGRVNFDYDIRMLSSGREDQRMFYPVLRKVEKAIRDLHFDRMRIDLYPPDTPGRSLQIRLAGVTTSEEVHAPIQLDININAPLDRFIRWGTNPVKP